MTNEIKKNGNIVELDFSKILQALGFTNLDKQTEQQLIEFCKEQYNRITSGLQSDFILPYYDNNDKLAKYCVIFATSPNFIQQLFYKLSNTTINYDVVNMKNKILEYAKIFDIMDSKLQNEIIDICFSDTDTTTLDSKVENKQYSADKILGIANDLKNSHLINQKEFSYILQNYNNPEKQSLIKNLIAFSDAKSLMQKVNSVELHLTFGNQTLTKTISGNTTLKFLLHFYIKSLINENYEENDSKFVEDFASFSHILSNEVNLSEMSTYNSVMNDNDIEDIAAAVVSLERKKPNFIQTIANEIKNNQSITKITDRKYYKEIINELNTNKNISAIKNMDLISYNIDTCNSILSKFNFNQQIKNLVLPIKYNGTENNLMLSDIKFQLSNNAGKDNDKDSKNNMDLATILYINNYIYNTHDKYKQYKILSSILKIYHEKIAIYPNSFTLNDYLLIFNNTIRKFLNKNIDEAEIEISLLKNMDNILYSKLMLTGNCLMYDDKSETNITINTIKNNLDILNKLKLNSQDLSATETQFQIRHKKIAGAYTQLMQNCSTEEEKAEMLRYLPVMRYGKTYSSQENTLSLIEGISYLAFFEQNLLPDVGNLIDLQQFNEILFDTQQNTNDINKVIEIGKKAINSLGINVDGIRARVLTVLKGRQQNATVKADLKNMENNIYTIMKYMIDAYRKGININIDNKDRIINQFEESIVETLETYYAGLNDIQFNDKFDTAVYNTLYYGNRLSSERRFEIMSKIYLCKNIIQELCQEDDLKDLSEALAAALIMACNKEYDVAAITATIIKSIKTYKDNQDVLKNYLQAKDGDRKILTDLEQEDSQVLQNYVNYTDYQNKQQELIFRKNYLHIIDINKYKMALDREINILNTIRNSPWESKYSVFKDYTDLFLDGMTQDAQLKFLSQLSNYSEDEQNIFRLLSGYLFKYDLKNNNTSSIRDAENVYKHQTKLEYLDKVDNYNFTFNLYDKYITKNNGDLQFNLDNFELSNDTKKIFFNAPIADQIKTIFLFDKLNENINLYQDIDISKNKEIIFLGILKSVLNNNENEILDNFFGKLSLTSLIEQLSGAKIETLVNDIIKKINSKSADKFEDSKSIIREFDTRTGNTYNGKRIDFPNNGYLLSDSQKSSNDSSIANSVPQNIFITNNKEFSIKYNGYSYNSLYDYAKQCYICKVPNLSLKSNAATLFTQGVGGLKTNNADGIAFEIALPIGSNISYNFVAMLTKNQLNGYTNEIKLHTLDSYSKYLHFFKYINEVNNLSVTNNQNFYDIYCTGKPYKNNYEIIAECVDGQIKNFSKALIFQQNNIKIDNDDIKIICNKINNLDNDKKEKLINSTLSTEKIQQYFSVLLQYPNLNIIWDKALNQIANNQALPENDINKNFLSLYLPQNCKNNNQVKKDIVNYLESHTNDVDNLRLQNFADVLSIAQGDKEKEFYSTCFKNDKYYTNSLFYALKNNPVKFGDTFEKNFLNHSKYILSMVENIGNNNADVYKYYILFNYLNKNEITNETITFDKIYENFMNQPISIDLEEILKKSNISYAKDVLDRTQVNTLEKLINVINNGNDYTLIKSFFTAFAISSPDCLQDTNIMNNIYSLASVTTFTDNVKRMSIFDSIHRIPQEDRTKWWMDYLSTYVLNIQDDELEDKSSNVSICTLYNVYDELTGGYEKIQINNDCMAKTEENKSEELKIKNKTGDKEIAITKFKNNIISIDQVRQNINFQDFFESENFLKNYNNLVKAINNKPDDNYEELILQLSKLINVYSKQLKNNLLTEQTIQILSEPLISDLLINKSLEFNFFTDSKYNNNRTLLLNMINNSKIMPLVLNNFKKDDEYKEIRKKLFLEIVKDYPNLLSYTNSEKNVDCINVILSQPALFMNMGETERKKLFLNINALAKDNKHNEIFNQFYDKIYNITENKKILESMPSLKQYFELSANNFDIVKNVDEVYSKYYNNFCYNKKEDNVILSQGKKLTQKFLNCCLLSPLKSKPILLDIQDDFNKLTNIYVLANETDEEQTKTMLCAIALSTRNFSMAQYIKQYQTNTELFDKCIKFFSMFDLEQNNITKEKIDSMINYINSLKAEDFTKFISICDSYKQKCTKKENYFDMIYFMCQNNFQALPDHFVQTKFDLNKDPNISKVAYLYPSITSMYAEKNIRKLSNFTDYFLRPLSNISNNINNSYLKNLYNTITHYSDDSLNLFIDSIYILNYPKEQNYHTFNQNDLGEYYNITQKIAYAPKWFFNTMKDFDENTQIQVINTFILSHNDKDKNNKIYKIWQNQSSEHFFQILSSALKKTDNQETRNKILQKAYKLIDVYINKPKMIGAALFLMEKDDILELSDNIIDNLKTALTNDEGYSKYRDKVGQNILYSINETDMLTNYCNYFNIRRYVSDSDIAKYIENRFGQQESLKKYQDTAIAYFDKNIIKILHSDAIKSEEIINNILKTKESNSVINIINDQIYKQKFNTIFKSHNKSCEEELLNTIYESTKKNFPIATAIVIDGIINSKNAQEFLEGFKQYASSPSYTIKLLTFWLSNFDGHNYTDEVNQEFFEGFKTINNEVSLLDDIEAFKNNRAILKECLNFHREYISFLKGMKFIKNEQTGDYNYDNLFDMLTNTIKQLSTKTSGMENLPKNIQDAFRNVESYLYTCYINNLNKQPINQDEIKYNIQANLLYVLNEIKQNKIKNDPVPPKNEENNISQPAEYTTRESNDNIANNNSNGSNANINSNASNGTNFLPKKAKIFRNKLQENETIEFKYEEIIGNRKTNFQEILKPYQIELYDNSDINKKFENVNSSGALYDSVVSLIKDNLFYEEDTREKVCLKLEELCNHDLFSIFKSFNDFLKNADKNEIGDKKDIKETILNLMLIMCNCDDKGTLFEEMMLTNKIDTKYKTELVKEKILLNNIDCDTVLWASGVFGNILYNTDNLDNKDIGKVLQKSFVDGINQALEVNYGAEDFCDILSRSASENFASADLLSKVASKQFDRIQDKSIIDNTIYSLLISDIKSLEVRNNDSNRIPTLYNFCNLLNTNKQQKEVSENLVAIIEDPLLFDYYGDIGKILLDCKIISDTQNTDTYEKIIDGIADNIDYNNLDFAKEFIGSILNAGSQQGNENDALCDIAVDLYHKISQKQTVDKPSIESEELSDVLQDTGLKDYIQDKKSSEYEIIYDNRLVKKEHRDLNAVLSKIPLSPRERKTIEEQIKLMATPEEAFDLIDSVIKSNNTLVNAGLNNDKINLLNSDDKEIIRSYFEKKDLYDIYEEKSYEKFQKSTNEFVNQLQQYTDTIEVPWYHRRWFSKNDYRTLKKEAQGLVRNLKSKDKTFRNHKNAINNFIEYRLEKAKEAATYIAQYEYYNKIIYNEDGQFDYDSVRNAKNELRKISKLGYSFSSHKISKGGGWFIFEGWSRNRLYKQAQAALEKSNKALAVLCGNKVEVSQYSVNGKCYEIKDNIVPYEEEMTIKSKHLRELERVENPGFWQKLKQIFTLWGTHQTEVTRTAESAVTKEITKKFIQESSKDKSRASKMLATKSFFNPKVVLSELRTGANKSTNDEMKDIIFSSFNSNKTKTLSRNNSNP